MGFCGMKNIAFLIALVSTSVSAAQFDISSVDSNRLYSATKNLPVQGTFIKDLGNGVKIKFHGHKKVGSFDCKHYTIIDQKDHSKVLQKGDACKIDKNNWMFGKAKR
jgi:hypothetical protein